MERKQFLKMSVLAAGGTALAGSSFISCGSGSRTVKGSIIGANAATGHMLRDGAIPEPTKFVKKQVVIVGGGVSGLSAARELSKNGLNDFVLLELDEKPGGNAAHGSNNISAYPWGAHYIPLPNNNLTEYLDLLQSAGCITGYDDKGLPVYNEEHLCFDPEERLYINGRWQEGLVPNYGLSQSEQKEISRFLELMNSFRFLKGSDGLDAFAIPVLQSSADDVFRKLDSLTMEDWMESQQFRCKALHSYVNYCCRDDFGTPHSIVSAWAGIHYFASRKGRAANATYADVLTWPEGNGFLINKLLGDIEGGRSARGKTTVDVNRDKDTAGGRSVPGTSVGDAKRDGDRATGESVPKSIDVSRDEEIADSGSAPGTTVDDVNRDEDIVSGGSVPRTITDDVDRDGINSGNSKNILSNALCYRIQAGEQVTVDYYDTELRQSTRIEAEYCILAVPQFVAARLLNNKKHGDLVKEKMNYVPWMVANLKVKQVEERSGAPASWDNVIHDGYSLGYVDATHQLLQQQTPVRNFTYYLPLTAGDPSTERRKAYQLKHADWAKLIFDELAVIHPDISEMTEELNVMLWGHSMVQPRPGLIWGKGGIQALHDSVDRRIKFAHTDLSGISIFEEGFYQGLTAAKLIIKELVQVKTTSQS